MDTWEFSAVTEVRPSYRCDYEGKLLGRFGTK
jgi:hypothetical protein